MQLACAQGRRAERAESRRAVARPSVPMGTPPATAVEKDGDGVLEHEPQPAPAPAGGTEAAPTAPEPSGRASGGPAPSEPAPEPEPTAVEAELIDPEPEPADGGRARACRRDGTIVVRRHGRVTTGLALVSLGIKTLLFGSGDERRRG